VVAVHARSTHDVVWSAAASFEVAFARIALRLTEIAKFQNNLAAVVLGCLGDVHKVFKSDLMEQKHVFGLDVVVRVLLVVEDEETAKQLVQHVPQHNL
jgi:hypothetical protein